MADNLARNQNTHDLIGEIFSFLSGGTVNDQDLFHSYQSLREQGVFPQSEYQTIINKLEHNEALELQERESLQKHLLDLANQTRKGLMETLYADGDDAQASGGRSVFFLQEQDISETRSERRSFIHNLVLQAAKRYQIPEEQLFVFEKTLEEDDYITHASSVEDAYHHIEQVVLPFLSEPQRDRVGFSENSSEREGHKESASVGEEISVLLPEDSHSTKSGTGKDQNSGGNRGEVTNHQLGIYQAQTKKQQFMETQNSIGKRLSDKNSPSYIPEEIYYSVGKELEPILSDQTRQKLRTIPSNQTGEQDAADPTQPAARAMVGHLSRVDYEDPRVFFAVAEELVGAKYGEQVKSFAGGELTGKSVQYAKEGLRQMMREDLSQLFANTEAVTALFGKEVVSSRLFQEFQQMIQSQARSQPPSGFFGAIRGYITEYKLPIPASPTNIEELLRTNVAAQVGFLHRVHPRIGGNLPYHLYSGTLPRNSQDVLAMLFFASLDPETSFSSLLKDQKEILSYLKKGETPMAEHLSASFLPLLEKQGQKIKMAPGVLSYFQNFTLHSSLSMTYGANLPNFLRQFQWNGFVFTKNIQSRIAGSVVKRFGQSKILGFALSKGLAVVGGPVGIAITAAGVVNSGVQVLTGFVSGLFGASKENPDDKQALLWIVGAFIAIFVLILFPTFGSFPTFLNNELSQGIGGGGGPGSGGPYTPGVDCSTDTSNPFCQICLAAGTCSWPVASGCITQGPGLQHDTWGHSGQAIDIGVNGVDVFTLFSGTIVTASFNVDDNTYTSATDTTGYGNYVRIHTDSTPPFDVLFAHLSRLHPATIFVGQHVNANTKIGIADKTGHADGAHLHYETIGVPINNILKFPVPTCVGPADCASIISASGNSSCW